MEYRVLGPIEARRDGTPVEIGTYKQRALLALLLINANQVVSTDRIIDELWGPDAGSDRQNALWVNISGLRGALDPNRKKRTEGTVLLTRSPGYLLAIDEGAIDATRFERLAMEGRALLDADPAAASLVLSEALALWRGHAFEEFTYESFAQAEIARLEELRLATVEDRIGADLRVGRTRELVGELEGLVRQHPLRERLAGHLMVALYRSGRQADALRAFGALRTRLGEELGIEPSAELAGLEERIVLDDPELRQPEAARIAGGRSEPGLTVRGYELRERIGEGTLGFVYRAYQPAVGREVAIKVIRPELANNSDFIRKFEIEARTIATLEHPQIVSLYDYWREPDSAYLVTRLFPAGSLRDVLARGPMPWDRAARVIDQIGGALAAAHRRGVTHGDLRPANVLLDDEGNAYLADFGLSAGSGTIERSTYMAPEQQESGHPSAASDQYALAMVVDEVLRGATGSGGAPDAPLVGPAAGVIGRATSPNPQHRFADLASFVEALQSALGSGALEATERPVAADNPYKGLRAFDEGDAGDFFGRERLVERLVARLGHRGPQGRMVALVGPSGAGKSSVVRAGLIPALRGGAVPGSDHWFIVTMTPGNHPFESLEDALLKVAVDPPASVLEQLMDDGIGTALGGLLPEAGSQLLLVIDQLEELFSHTPATEADAFLSALAGTAADPHAPVKVVATLRADFYDRPLRHGRFGELLRLGTEVITSMTADELERAVASPARAAGVSFEAGLVARIVSDMAGQAAALPLMQYALTELFEQRTGSLITADAYEGLGGVSAALVRRAEGLYDSLDRAGQAAARDLFLRLVSVGEGMEDTRRRALLAELTDPDIDTMDPVLDTFGRHRLLSFDRDPVTRGPTLEIAHEALLTEWHRLAHWIDDARSDIQAQRRLAAAAADWRDRNQNPDFLLTGARLNRYSGWLTNPPVRLTQGEGQFLAASEDAEVARAEEHERQVRRDVQLRRRTLLLAALAATTAVVVALAAYAFTQRNRADDLAEEAAANAAAASASADQAQSAAEQATRLADALTRTDLALRLTTESANQRDDDPQLSLAMAIEAARATAEDTGQVLPTALDSIHWALQAARIQYPTVEGVGAVVRPGPAGPTGVPNLSPDQLIAHAQASFGRELDPDTDCADPFVSERGRTSVSSGAGSEESRQYLPGSCPDVRAPFPENLQIQGGSASYAVHPAGGTGLEGTEVSVVSVFSPGFGFEFLSAALDEVSEASGIAVAHTNPPEDRRAEDVARSDTPPDIVIFPQPGFVAELAREGLLMDISEYLDVEMLRDSYQDYLFSLSSVGPNGEWPAVDGSPVGVFIGIDGKSFMWHTTATFTDAGYRTPRTWDELIALSDQIVADGETPWCMALGSGDSSGWPASDWVESVILRTEGPQFYDRWVNHEIPFDHPGVVAAFERIGELAFGPGYVQPSAAGAAVRPFFDLGFLMTADPPQCLMLPFPNFAPSLPPGLPPGEAIELFDFPILHPDYASAMVGGGNIAVAMTDRPEVRAVIEAMAQPAWAEAWAVAGDGFAFVPANRYFDLDVFPTGAGRHIAAGVRAALADGTYRFDGSDSMPSEVEAAFLSALVRFFQEGPDSAEPLLSEVEAVWTDLEQGG